MLCSSLNHAYFKSNTAKLRTFFSKLHRSDQFKTLLPRTRKRNTVTT